ncbi:MAG: CdaR family protein [Spirochaetales bacterium]|nr:CdaR family protein [Spirochaetales bacterium]
MRNASVFARIMHRWPVKALCIALAGAFYLLFRVNTFTERVVTVPLQVITPEGFVVSSEYPGSINLTLRGETQEIAGVLPDDIDAFVDLSSFPDQGEYRVPVEFRKKGSALQPEALELRSRPREVQLAMERRTVRSLIVRPELSGFPALGYELTQFIVSPSSVTAVGPQSQMTGLTELKTEIIDLSGRRDDFTVSTRLVRPSGQIELPGGEVVEFKGVVDEAVVIRTIADREVVVFDLPEGLSIQSELPRVSLTVQGSQLTVEGARPGDMTFYVDGSSIRRPGTYELPLKMDIPPGLAVLQLVPRRVTVTVVRESLTIPQTSSTVPAPASDLGVAVPFGSENLPAYASVGEGEPS